jgi:Ca2+-binding RTX toxin-like protein
MASVTPAIWASLGRVNTSDVTLDGNGQYSAKVIALAGGGFVVAWEDDTNTHSFGLGPNDIAGQRFDAFGGAIGAEFNVSAVYQDLNQQAVALAATADGGFLAAYQSEDAAGINDGENIDVSIFDPSGSFTRHEDFRQGFTPGAAVNDTAPSIATFAGGYILAYETNALGDRDIGYHIVTSPFSFPNPPPPIVSIGAIPGEQVDPQIAIIADHAINPVFAIVFQDGPSGAIRSYVGNAAGEITTVTLSTGTGNSAPALAALAAGGYVAVWCDAQGDGSGSGIRFRIGTSEGDLLGAGPSTANTTVAGTQDEPTVAALVDGGFAVAWRDGATNVIRVQVFSSAGAKIGTEAVISEPGTVSEPELALLGDGRLVLTYTVTVGDNEDVYATILDARTGAVTGTDGDDVLTAPITGGSVSGLNGNDGIYGSSGNDVLNGGAGNDVMRGGAGNDIYVVAAAGDQTIEAAGEGTDTVRSYIDWVLANHVERLELQGSGNLNGTGNALNNTLVGNSGNNLLNGGAGNDYMVGGAGNDTFIVAAAGDRTIEAAAGGTDTVRSYINWTLGANIERLELQGPSNLNGTGNALNNTLVGNSGNNSLNGGDGNDYIVGGAGNDTLTGGVGNDTLIGGAGGDILNGGAGNDRFDFDLVSDSPAGPALRDSIVGGFSHGSDRIDLATIDANTLVAGNQAFSFIGSAAFSGVAGQLRYTNYSGNVIIDADVNGDSTADMQILVAGTTFMTGTDFIL